MERTNEVRTCTFGSIYMFIYFRKYRTIDTSDKRNKGRFLYLNIFQLAEKTAQGWTPALAPRRGDSAQETIVPRNHALIRTRVHVRMRPCDTVSVSAILRLRVSALIFVASAWKNIPIAEIYIAHDAYGKQSRYNLKIFIYRNLPCFFCHIYL